MFLWAPRPRWYLRAARQDLLLPSQGLDVQSQVALGDGVSTIPGPRSSCFRWIKSRLFLSDLVDHSPKGGYLHNSEHLPSHSPG